MDYAKLMDQLDSYSRDLQYDLTFHQHKTTVAVS